MSMTRRQLIAAFPSARSTINRRTMEREVDDQRDRIHAAKAQLAQERLAFRELLERWGQVGLVDEELG